MSTPITPGTGAASVAAEAVGGLQYQQVEIYGGGGASVLSVNPDGSFKASIIGTPTVNAQQLGTTITSIVSTIPSSVLVGASIFGTAPVTQSGSWSASIAGGFANLYAPTSSFISGVTSIITGTALTSVLSAAGGSIKNYVTHILVTNGAASGTFVDVYDGGGNVIYSGYAAASGGGFSATLPVPLVGSANKSVDVKARTQASIIAAMTGYTT